MAMQAKLRGGPAARCPPPSACLLLCRLQQGSEDQGREVQQAISNLDAQEASLDLDIRNRDTEVQQLQVGSSRGGCPWPCASAAAEQLCGCPGPLLHLQAQKEQQSEGEVKHLVQLVDDLSKQVVKGTSSWENKKELQEAELVGIAQAEASLEELGEAGLQARLEAATAARNEAQQACERAQAGLVAAQNELAGAEAGDGRDGSNRSMQERLVDAQNAQVGCSLPLAWVGGRAWGGGGARQEGYAGRAVGGGNSPVLHPSRCRPRLWLRPRLLRPASSTCASRSRSRRRNLQPRRRRALGCGWRWRRRGTRWTSSGGHPEHFICGLSSKGALVGRPPSAEHF